MNRLLVAGCLLLSIAAVWWVVDARSGDNASEGASGTDAVADPTIDPALHGRPPTPGDTHEAGAAAPLPPGTPGATSATLHVTLPDGRPLTRGTFELRDTVKRSVRFSGPIRGGRIAVPHSLIPEAGAITIDPGGGHRADGVMGVRLLHLDLRREIPRVQLRQGRTVTGVVVDADGDPEFQVPLGVALGTPVDGRIDVAALPRKTDDYGRFTAVLPADEEVTITASSTRIDRAVGRARVPLGVDHVRIELPPDVSLRVQLAGLAPEQLLGLPVIIETQGTTAKHTSQVKSDKDGVAMFHDLPPDGLLTVRVDNPGHKRVYIPAVVPDIRASSGEVTVRLSAGHELAGEVVTEDGHAIIGAWVRLRPPDGADGPAYAAKADADGKFRLRGLERDRHEMRVSSTGFIRTDPLSVSTSQSPLRIVLRETFTLTGRVPQAASEACLAIWSSTKVKRWTVVSDEHLQFDLLPDEEGILFVWCPTKQVCAVRRCAGDAGDLGVIGLEAGEVLRFDVSTAAVHDGNGVYYPERLLLRVVGGRLDITFSPMVLESDGGLVLPPGRYDVELVDGSNGHVFDSVRGARTGGDPVKLQLPVAKR